MGWTARPYPTAMKEATIRHSRLILDSLCVENLARPSFPMHLFARPLALSLLALSPVPSQGTWIISDERYDEPPKELERQLSLLEVERCSFVTLPIGRTISWE